MRRARPMTTLGIRHLPVSAMTVSLVSNHPTVFRLQLTLILASEFCREGQCSNPPITPLGGACVENQDCEGTIFGLPVYCSPLGRCGGPGALCTADDETADRNSEACVSGASPFCLLTSIIVLTTGHPLGICSARIALDPVPVQGSTTWRNDNLRRNGSLGNCAPETLFPVPLVNMATKYVLFTPKLREAPMADIRKQCIDVQSSLESCGGCLGSHRETDGHSAGVDCTALPNVDSVSCVFGECVIGTSKCARSEDSVLTAATLVSLSSLTISAPAVRRDS